MKDVWTIFKRELSSYFTQPIAYAIIVIYLLLSMVFTFTSETGGTLLYGGVVSGFGALRGIDDWLGTRMYIQTALTNNGYPVHFRLRFGRDQVFPAYFAGRHGGAIIYYGSGQDEEPTSGNMTLTR